MSDRAGEGVFGHVIVGVHHFFRILGQFSYISHRKSVLGYHLFRDFE